MKEKENLPRRRKAREKRALLLGIGLDCDDEQKRVTVGKNFFLTGGSKPTHEQMQESAIKLNEELDRRGKRLEDVGPDEFVEIADKSGLGGNRSKLRHASRHTRNMQNLPSFSTNSV